MKEKRKQEIHLKKSEALRTLDLLNNSDRSGLFLKWMALTLNEASASLLSLTSLVGLKHKELN